MNIGAAARSVPFAANLADAGEVATFVIDGLLDGPGMEATSLGINSCVGMLASGRAAMSFFGEKVLAAALSRDELTTLLVDVRERLDAWDGVNDGALGRSFLRGPSPPPLVSETTRFLCCCGEAWVISLISSRAEGVVTER